jgi:hypothetical protein
VEGNEDRWAVIRLLEQNGISCDTSDTPQMPYIHDSNGYNALLDSLPTAVKTYQKLGVMIDANLEPEKRWLQLKNKLERAGVTLPAQPLPEGTIAQGQRPDYRTGIWMMPDNSQPGALEEFLAGLIPQQDACWPYTDEVCTEAQARGAPFPGSAFMKARIRTWLAWRKKPGLPAGTALKAGYFRHDSELVSRFVSWFRQLFLEETPRS